MLTIFIYIQILLSDILKNNDLLMRNLEPEKNCLNDATRQLLVDAIIKHFIETKQTMTVAICKSMAEQICKNFTDEVEVSIKFKFMFY